MQLYKVSERLKILLCKKISNQMYKLEIPDYVKSSSDKETITIQVSVETKKGILSQSEFYLSIKELVKVMSVFMKSSRIPTSIKGQEEYNNIFVPIESAIKKANVCKFEIDYVLLIGGSAQNPFYTRNFEELF